MENSPETNNPNPEAAEPTQSSGETDSATPVSDKILKPSERLARIIAGLDEIPDLPDESVVDSAPRRRPSERELARRREEIMETNPDTNFRRR